MSTPSLRALEERLRSGPIAVRDAATAVPPAILLAWAFDTLERSLAGLTGLAPADDLHTGRAVGQSC